MNWLAVAVTQPGSQLRTHYGTPNEVNAMPNDGIVSTFSEGDLARLTRRKDCRNEQATPVLHPGENDETRAVQLPPVIGLPPVDDDINRRSGEPLFDPSPHPSSEEENSLWSTPQQLAMRARQKLYAIAPAPVDEDIHHRSGEPLLNSGLSRSSDPDWQAPLMMMMARRIVRRSVILFLVVSAIATPLAYFWTAKSSNHVEFFNSRGAAYYRKGDYDRAVDDYGEAIRLDPRSAIVYNSRGNAYYRKGDYDHAIADYTEVIRLDPKSAIAYNGRGNAYYGNNDYDHAIVDYTEAIRLSSSYSAAYNGRGNAYYHKNDYEHAITDYNKAIQLDPQFAIAYSDRGDAYEKRGELQWAMADYKLALRFDASLQRAAEGIKRLTQAALQHRDTAPARRPRH